MFGFKRFGLWAYLTDKLNVGLALVRRGPPPPKQFLGFSGILNNLGRGWDGGWG